MVVCWQWGGSSSVSKIILLLYFQNNIQRVSKTSYSQSYVGDLSLTLNGLLSNSLMCDVTDVSLLCVAYTRRPQPLFILTPPL